MPKFQDLSLRERYIIAQALVLGIEKLAEVEGPHREMSNMLDMGELLNSAMFAPFAGVILATQSAIGDPAITAATIVHKGLGDVHPPNEDEGDVEDLPF